MVRKKIIITGASSGIGLHLAKNLSEVGFEVISVARFSKNKSCGNNTHKLDIDDYHAVKRFVVSQKKIYGVINCVGAYGEIGPFHEVDFERWQLAFKTNFFSVANFCREMIAHDLDKFNTLRRIINFSGGGAFNPMANFSCYSTSKAAIVRFTENLALEYRDYGITVNAISPGFIATPIHDAVLSNTPEQCGKEMFEHIREGVASNKGNLEAVTKLAAFLLAEDTDFVSGRTLSAVWDSWDEGETFKRNLNSKPNLYKMTRIDEKTSAD